MDRNVSWRCDRQIHWTTHLQGAGLVCVQGLWCHELRFCLWSLHSKRRNTLSQELVERLHKPGAEGEFGCIPSSSITVGHRACHRWARTRTRGLWESLTVYCFHSYLLRTLSYTSYCRTETYTSETDRQTEEEWKRERKRDEETLLTRALFYEFFKGTPAQKNDRKKKSPARRAQGRGARWPWTPLAGIASKISSSSSNVL